MFRIIMAIQPIPIPISCVRTLLPFVDLLIEVGAPVDAWLTRHRLPYQLYEDPEGFIPTRSYWDFVSFAAKKEGIEDLGLRVGHDRTYDALSVRVLARSYSAPTLYTGLREFARCVRGEYSGMKVRLSEAPNDSVHLKLCKSFELGTPGFVQTEWLGLIALVKVVQLFTGPTWQPDEIALKSDSEVLPLASALYPDVRFRTRQPESYISFPKDLLSTRPWRGGSKIAESLEHSDQGWVPREPPEDFPDSLQRILVSYLRDGYPSVDFAAEIAGMSRRTLQRRLGRAGLSYSELVDRARFDIATRLLSQTDATSLEIAFETGYEDPSHFARMFRRLSGCSPREYRRRQAIQ